MPAADCQLRLFRFVQDAWEDGMRDWLRAHAAAGLRGEQAWVVVADLAQAGWLRRKSLSAGVALLGVKFLTVSGLRRELAALLGEECRLLGRESLEFLLKLEALEHGGAEGRSVALDAAQCLQALEDLGRAGWSGDEADLGAVPSPAREWLRVLAGSGAWAPEIDRLVLRKLSSRQAAKTQSDFGLKKLHLCFWAWDKELGAERALLEAALTVGRDAVFFMPSPLEELEFNWVSELEQLCGASAEVCGESGFVSANEELTEHLFRRGESLTVTRLPAVLAGETEADELALLEREVWRCLEDGDADGDGQIGVVFPRRSVLSRRLAGRLSAAGLPVLDQIGALEPESWAAAVQDKLAAYYLYGCQVDDFLSLTVAWHAAGGDVEPMALRRRLKDLFRQRQTRRVTVLLKDSGAAAGALALTLGEWPERAEWGELKLLWQRAARAVGCGTECLEPLWSRLDAVLAGRAVDGRVFLEYVRGLLKPSRTSRSASAAFAKIELVTPRQAAGRGWRHLIFAESNEGRWPLAVKENPFLTDAARAALNHRRGARRGWLFTAGERGLLEEWRLRGLLENCRGTTTFTASAHDAAEPERELYPNGLVSHTLMLREGGSALAAWRRLVVRMERHSPEWLASSAQSQILGASHILEATLESGAPCLDAAEFQRLQNIAARRNDPTLPFDEFSFCYPQQFAEGLRWSVTKLEDLADCPATAALALLFDAQAADDEDFQRNEHLPAGTLTHEWLRRYLADGVPTVAERAARMAAVEAGLRRELNVSGLWMETLFRSVRWMAGELLAAAEAAGLAEAATVSVERSVGGVVRTAAGDLSLKGRMDLVLADGDAWRVIDFKTGKADAPTAGQLERGEGLQFGAYLLLALANGARSATVQCLSPKRSMSRTLTMAEVGAAEQGLSHAARVQQTLRFGIGAGRDRNAWCERLPLAHVPADSGVLAEKGRIHSLTVSEN